MAHNINRCSVCRHSVWRGAVPHLQVESQWQQNFFRINFWFANERQVHGEGECWPRLLGSIIHSWSVEPSRNFHNIQGPSSCWKCLLVLLSHHTASDLRNYAKRAFKHGEYTWNWDFYLANIVKVSRSFVVSSNCWAMLQVGSPGPGLLQSAGSYESLDEMRRSSLAGGSISMLDTLSYSSCDRWEQGTLLLNI